MKSEDESIREFGQKELLSEWDGWCRQVRILSREGVPYELSNKLIISYDERKVER